MKLKKCQLVQNQIISKSHNQTELLSDVTAHAEILAITSASSQLDMKYLKKCTLYVSLEPCIMCAGALRWSQLGRLVYAAEDRKQGFMRFGKELLHPKMNKLVDLVDYSLKFRLYSCLTK